MFQRKNPGGSFGNKNEGTGKLLSILYIFEKNVFLKNVFLKMDLIKDNFICAQCVCSTFRGYFSIMKNIGKGILLVLVLSGVMTMAEEPSISYKVEGNELVINYTEALYQSEDAVRWEKVENAVNPYKIMMGQKNLYFCSKKEPVNKNFTLFLSDVASLNMIWVEPGSFGMGSPENEIGRSNDEKLHQVILTKGYWLGMSEVTQGQYKTVTGENPSGTQGMELPVEKVTWFEAISFCTKINELEKIAGRLPEGYEYSLPTEAQWEYACRAGTSTPLNSGKELSPNNMDEVGWYQGNSYLQTHPVETKQKNFWGFYDMHGNAWEWCRDWYSSTYYEDAVMVDPKGPETGARRVLRGGSWSESMEDCRSAVRYYFNPNERANYAGFRLALVPVEK